MAFRLEITYTEIFDILDMKYVDTSNIGYTLEPGMYEISHIRLMVKSKLPNELK